MNRNPEQKEPRTLPATAILAAVLILMSFTPFGYLHIGVVSMSLLMLPAAVGAVTCGVRSAVILSALFGLTSFLQCFGNDSFGKLLYSVSPALTFLACMLPRLLAGLCTGLSGRHARRLGLCSYAICGFCGAVFNSVFTFLAIVLCFWQTPAFCTAIAGIGIETDSLFSFFTAFLGFNFMFEAIACFTVTFLVGWLMERAGMISAVNPFEHDLKGLLNR